MRGTPSRTPSFSSSASSSGIGFPKSSSRSDMGERYGRGAREGACGLVRGACGRGAGALDGSTPSSGGPMPEAPEIETEKLHEAIEEQLEKQGGGFIRKIALTTALLAALAALASLEAGATVNEALVLESEASDQWAYYQAKGVKASIAESAAATFAAAGKEAPPAYEERRRRYAEEQDAIQEKAKEKERERDAKERAAGQLLHVHHRYAAAVAFFQVSIALGAVAALTRIRLVWLASMAIGVAGIVFAVLALAGRP